MPGSTTTRGRQTSRECDVYHVAFCWSGEHRHPEFVLRRSIPGLLIPLSMLHDGPRRSPRMTSGSVWLATPCTATDFHRLPSAGLPGAPGPSH